MKTYRIKDWNRVFENHRSRELKALDYVSWPVRSTSEAFKFLMRSQEGVLAFGVFSALVAEAARCPARGVLADEKGPITVRRMALRLGTPESVIEAAVKLLTSDDVGWLEEFDDATASDPETTERDPSATSPRDCREIAAGSRDAAATLPRDSARSTRDSAPRPLLSIPIHSEGISASKSSAGETPSKRTGRTTASSNHPVGESRFMDFVYAFPPNKRSGMNKAMKRWAEMNLDAVADQIFAALNEAKRDPKWVKQFAPRIDLWLDGEPWKAATSTTIAQDADPDADARFVRQLAPDAVERFVAATKAQHPKYAHWPKSYFLNAPPPEFVAIVRKELEGANAA